MKKQQSDCVAKFENSILLFCKRYNILKSDKILLSFSGGADSLALLIALKSLGFENTCALYVNHHLRSDDELENELDLNKSNTEKLGVELIVLDVDKDKMLLLMQKSGLEGAARALRYDLIKTYAKNNDCKYIFTAHNQTDLDEEDIIQFFRGADTFNSLKEKSGNIYRPMLDITHSNAEDYVKKKGFIPSIDSTNFDNEHLRSKVRIELRERLDKVFPSFSKSFANRRKISNNSNLKQEIYSSFRLLNINNSNNGRITLKDVDSIVDFMENGNNTGKIEYCDSIIFHTPKKDKRDVVIKRKEMDFCFSNTYTLDDFKKGRIELANSEIYNVFELNNENAFKDYFSLPSNSIILGANSKICFRSYKDDDVICYKGKDIKVSEYLKLKGIKKELRPCCPCIEVDEKLIGIILNTFSIKNFFVSEFNPFSYAKTYIFVTSSNLFY